MLDQQLGNSCVTTMNCSKKRIAYRCASVQNRSTFEEILHDIDMTVGGGSLQWSPACCTTISIDIEAVCDKPMADVQLAMGSSDMEPRSKRSVHH